MNRRPLPFVLSLALTMGIIWWLRNPAVHAAFSSNARWVVETTGSDSNGGAFASDVSSPGTDQSLSGGQAYTDIVIGATTTQATSALHPFTATTNGPGNFIHISGGAGCTVQWVEMLSQSGGTATFDKSLGTAASICTGQLGNPLLTIGQANTNAVASNTIAIQSGTYTLTSAVAFTAVNLTVQGFGTTPGDGGTRPLITTSTNSTNLFSDSTASASTMILDNLSFSNTATTRAYGIVKLASPGPGNTLIVKNCIFDGLSTAIIGDNAGANWYWQFVGVSRTEVKNSTVIGTSVAGGGAGQGLWVVNSYYHGNTGGSAGNGGVNIQSNAMAVVHGSIFDGNTNGVYISNLQRNPAFSNNDFTNNTTNGLYVNFTAGGGFTVYNSVFYGNGTGVNTNQTPSGQGWGWCNAFGSNTTNYTGWAASPGDVSLTANPFTSSTDFTPNSTAGGGAVLRTGCTAKFGGASFSTAPTIGAIQVAGTSSSTIGYPTGASLQIPLTPFPFVAR